MRRTKEDADITHQSLLDTALRVFSEKGYAAARLEDVAAAAHVTRGAIYHHFGSKAELFATLIEEAAQNSSQVVQGAIQEGGSFLDITRRVLVNTLRFLDDDPHFRGTMALMLLHSSDSPELGLMVSQQVAQGNQTVSQVADFFRIGLAQGVLRPNLDAEVAARAFLAYQNGLILMTILSPGTLLPEQAVSLADIFVQGIARS